MRIVRPAVYARCAAPAFSRCLATAAPVGGVQVRTSLLRPRAARACANTRSRSRRLLRACLRRPQNAPLLRSRVRAALWPPVVTPLPLARPSRPSAAQTFLDKAEVTDRVLSVLKNFEKVDPAKVKAEAHFVNDLGLDSLDAVEVRRRRGARRGARGGGGGAFCGAPLDPVPARAR